MSTKRTLEDFKQIPFRLGCDPELFLYDLDRKMYVSAHPYIPGNKQKPHALSCGGSVQLDGLACELGTMPQMCARDFVFHLKEVIDEVRAMLPKNIVLRATPSAWFDKDYFDKEVPDYCKELGCEPDFDAYNNGAKNPRPNGMIIKNNKVLRTGAGHLHISWGDNMDTSSDYHRWNCITLTQALDTLLYPVSKIWDKDDTRMQMYGKPGTYRPKPYGLEYRVLSNAWLQHDTYCSTLFDATRFMLEGTFITGKLPHFSVMKYDYEGYPRFKPWDKNSPTLGDRLYLKESEQSTAHISSYSCPVRVAQTPNLVAKDEVVR
jgi:hypothetical protein